VDSSRPNEKEDELKKNEMEDNLKKMKWKTISKNHGKQPKQILKNKIEADLKKNDDDLKKKKSVHDSS
jgi:hypothetical protein